MGFKQNHGRGSNFMSVPQNIGSLRLTEAACLEALSDHLARCLGDRCVPLSGALTTSCRLVLCLLGAVQVGLGPGDSGIETTETGDAVQVAHIRHNGLL